MIGTYESNDRGNDYLSHHPHNAFILATCQKSGILCSHSIKLGYMLHDTDDPTNHIWPFNKTVAQFLQH